MTPVARSLQHSSMMSRRRAPRIIPDRRATCLSDDINIEPVHVTLRVGYAYTGDSRSAILPTRSAKAKSSYQRRRSNAACFRKPEATSHVTPARRYPYMTGNEKFRQLRELRKPAPLNPNDPKRWDSAGHQDRRARSAEAQARRSGGVMRHGPQNETRRAGAAGFGR